MGLIFFFFSMVFVGCQTANVGAIVFNINKHNCKENIILRFSKNCYCYLNLMFSMFFITKKKETNVFSLFSCLLRTENRFQKQELRRS